MFRFSACNIDDMDEISVGKKPQKKEAKLTPVVEPVKKSQNKPNQKTAKKKQEKESVSNFLETVNH